MKGIKPSCVQARKALEAARLLQNKQAALNALAHVTLCDDCKKWLKNHLHFNSIEQCLHYLAEEWKGQQPLKHGQLKSEHKGNLNKLLRRTATEGVIACPNCGRTLEPDAPKCVCGWENRLVKEGWI